MWFDRVVEFTARVLNSNRNHKVPVCPALMNMDIFTGYTARKAYHVLRSLCVRIRWLKLAWAHFEAIEYVQARRPIVSPDLGLRHQLVVWAYHLGQEKRWREKSTRSGHGGEWVIEGKPML